MSKMKKTNEIEIKDKCCSYFGCWWIGDTMFGHAAHAPNGGDPVFIVGYRNEGGTYLLQSPQLVRIDNPK